MAAIWRWRWTLAVLSLWPLAVGAYVATRTPSVASVTKPHIERVPARTCFGEAKNVGICSWAQVCWEVRKPGC